MTRRTWNIKRFDHRNLLRAGTLERANGMHGSRCEKICFVLGASFRAHLELVNGSN